MVEQPETERTAVARGAAIIRLEATALKALVVAVVALAVFPQVHQIALAATAAPA
jgi:hypothetical protein